eukprot:14561806-Alexandrium_andersonii.AAC.1
MAFPTASSLPACPADLPVGWARYPPDFNGDLSTGRYSVRSVWSSSCSVLPIDSVQLTSCCIAQALSLIHI